MNQIELLTQLIYNSGLIEQSTGESDDENDVVALKKPKHRIDWPALLAAISHDTGASYREISRSCGLSATAINQFFNERSHYEGGDRAVDLLLLYLLNCKGKPLPRLGDNNHT